MKKFILALTLLVASSLHFTSNAQNINININIGSQPAWGPVGYDYVNYYYMPDINVYYNVPQSVFYYWNGGRWISAQYLPYSYRNYDLYHMYKVVINDGNPWRRNTYHVKNYARYRGVRNQVIIYNSNDHRYRDSRRNTIAWHNNGNKHKNNYKSENRYSNRSTVNTGRPHQDNRYNNNRSSENRNDNNKGRNINSNQRNNSSERYNNRSNNTRSNSSQTQLTPISNKSDNRSQSKDSRSSSRNEIRSNNRR